MRLKWQIPALACVLMCASLARGQSELVTQAQAADVLADLITYTVEQAEVRSAALSKFINDAGKADEFARFKPSASDAKPLPFNDVFKGAVLFVRNGGAKFANPAIASMNDAQLSNELTELQVYNIQEFIKLNQQKKSVDSMREYLSSTGQLEKYKQATKDDTIGLAPAANPEDVSARMDLAIKGARARAWRKAQSRGMTQAQFEQEWTKRVQLFRDSVAQQVDGVKSLAKSLSEPPPPPPAAPKFEPAAVPVYPQAPPPARISEPSLPPTVQSGATNAMYQQQNNELWNRFEDD